MIDPRPSISEEIDLTELNIFSGYKNRFSVGNQHVDADMFDYEAYTKDWVKSLKHKLIGFDSFIDGAQDSILDAYHKKHIITSPVRKKMRHDLLKEGLLSLESHNPNGICEVCGTQLKLPTVIRNLYPKYYEHGETTLYTDPIESQCPRCALTDLIGEIESQFGFNRRTSDYGSTLRSATNTWNDVRYTFNNDGVDCIVEYFINHSVNSETCVSETAMIPPTELRKPDIIGMSSIGEISENVTDNLKDMVTSLDDIWVDNIGGLRYSLGIGSGVVDGVDYDFQDMLDMELDILVTSEPVLTEKVRKVLRKVVIAVAIELDIQLYIAIAPTYSMPTMCTISCNSTGQWTMTNSYNANFSSTSTTTSYYV